MGASPAEGQQGDLGAGACAISGEAKSAGFV